MLFLRRVLLFSALFLLVTPFNSWADPASAPKLAPSTGDLPTVDGMGILTVSGPGGYWHRDSYEDGEQPYLSVHDSSGHYLADGHYSYEFKSFHNGQDMGGQAEGASLQLDSSSRSAGISVIGRFEIAGGEMIFH